MLRLHLLFGLFALGLLFSFGLFFTLVGGDAGNNIGKRIVYHLHALDNGWMDGALIAIYLRLTQFEYVVDSVPDH